MHYDITELEPPIKGWVRLMWFTHILVLLVTILNLIGTAIQVA